MRGRAGNFRILDDICLLWINYGTSPSALPARNTRSPSGGATSAGLAGGSPLAAIRSNSPVVRLANKLADIPDSGGQTRTDLLSPNCFSSALTTFLASNELMARQRIGRSRTLRPLNSLAV